jgi:O-antigen/teichoic acid export membrane protein
MECCAENRVRLRDRLIYGTVWNFVAVAFNQGSTLIANILVARILLKQTFGEYAMVQSTLLMMAALSQLATGYTASKYIAECRDSDPERAGQVMGLCAHVSWVTALAGAILLIALSPWLAGAILKAPHLSPALMAGSGFLFFSVINGYQMGALSGLEAYGSLAKAGMASGLLAAAAIPAGAWWGGLNGTLIGLSLSGLLRFAVHYGILRRESRIRGIKPHCRGSLKHAKAVLLRFALPAALAGYYSMPMIWLANSFLVRQPGGYGEMALYASSSSVKMVVLFIPQVVNTVSLSVLNSMKGEGDDRRYRRLYFISILAIFMATAAAASGFGLFGAGVLGLFGKEFRAGGPILRILMIAAVFEGLSIALYQHLQVQGKIWLSLYAINIPREALFVILAFLLVPARGAVGLSLSYTLCWLSTLLVIAVLVYRGRNALKKSASGRATPGS